MLELCHSWVDLSECPLYTVAPSGRITDEELEAFLSDLDRWYGVLDHPFAFVIDLTASQAPSLRQQGRMSTAEKRYRFADYRYNRGQAFVVASPVWRGIVNVVWTMSGPTYPHAVFGTREEARAWALDRLKGVPSQPRVSIAPPQG